jgi:hypothetical protein
MRTLDGTNGVGLLLLAALIGGCSPRGGGPVNGEVENQTFASAEEAAGKAKADLLAVLQGETKLSAGVDAASVERSQPGKPIERFDVMFEKLLEAEPTAGFDSLVAEGKDTVVPLVADGDVVTIVQLRRDSAGWRVVGLAGKEIADDLATLRTVVGDPDASIAIYEVPNLDARIYRVEQTEGDRPFTRYGGRSLREPMATDALVAALKQDALAFQAEYAERLRKEPLLR